MDALSSISPYSANPETRKGADPLGGRAFSMEGASSHEPRATRPASDDSARDGAGLPHHEPLAEACALACGPARPEAIERVGALMADHPEIASRAKLWRDERGAPLQALPAIACAAIQGADPEGWAEPLLALGAAFDARVARAAAREELLEMDGPRGGRIQALNARCEALSIWTIACAEASHPHSALRAVEAARRAAPAALAPLASELARFADPRAWDKPSVPARSRAGAFVEAARSDPQFCSRILPSWALGPRGEDVASIASPIADSLGVEESIELASALRGPEAGAPAQALAEAALAALARRRPASA